MSDNIEVTITLFALAGISFSFGYVIGELRGYCKGMRRAGQLLVEEAARVMAGLKTKGDESQ